MTNTATQNTEKRSAARKAASNPLTAGRLPGWSVWAIAAGGAAVAAIIIFLTSLGNADGFNWAGFVVLGLLFSVTAIYVVSLMTEGKRQATNRFVTSRVLSTFVLALIPLLSLIITLFTRGMARLDAEFFSSSMRGIVDVGGGAAHAIWGTVLITLTATLLSVPIGIFTAIYLVEYGKGWLKNAINFFVDVMTGIPSIVAGLFVFTMLFAATAFTPLTPATIKTGLAGALALTILMLPTVIRSSEEMLRLVPNELREASYALGTPKWVTIVKIVLPTALAGIATGVTLAISRVIGETAPLLIAAGVAQASLNTNLVKGQMMSLPVFVYQMTKGAGVAQQPWFEMAWTAALVLLIIVMVLNLIARAIAYYFRPKGER